MSSSNGSAKATLVRNGSQAASASASSDSKKIKALVLTSTGSGSDYSNLKLKDEDYPSVDGVAGREEYVVVRVKAAGLNFAELMQRQGLYRPATKCPYTPGYEAAGVVEQVGSGVTDFKVDDRVIVFNGNGMWKEVVVVPAKNAIKMPDGMSFDDGASFIVNYLTAYQTLFRMGNLKQNEVVLIHMAAGGVGTAAVQLCKTVPGVVVIGTASASKHDAIRENGVTHAIDYTTQDYVQEVKKLYPNGVDLVLDPLNGENSIKGFGLLRPFGRIVHFGAASISSESRSLMNAFKAWWKCLQVNSLDLIAENKSVCGYHLAYLLNQPACRDQLIDDVRKLLEMYVSGAIKIKVDSVFSFARIGEAMKRMHQRQNIGKILLKPESEITPVATPSAGVEQVQIVTPTTPKTPETTKPSGPTSETTGKQQNGQLPKITPSKVTNGEHVESEKTTEKLANGDHHHDEKAGDGDKSKVETKKSDDAGEITFKVVEVNGDHVTATVTTSEEKDKPVEAY